VQTNTEMLPKLTNNLSTSHFIYLFSQM